MGAVLIFWLAMLASCALGSEDYLRDSLDLATQNDIVARWGLPAMEQPGADGTTVLTYEYRVNRLIPVCRDIPVSDCVRGRQECIAYRLTFDTEKILRRWTKHPCS
ncbi:MAG: hypothetical protein AB1555_15535 [Nitrospirota bacterium]